MTNDLPPLAYIDAYKPGIDLTLIRDNLKLTPTQRLQKLEESLTALDELRRAAERSGVSNRRSVKGA